MFAEQGQHVEVGDVIMKLNLDVMNDNGISVVVPTVIAQNGDFVLQMLEEKRTIEVMINNKRFI